MKAIEYQQHDWGIKGYFNAMASPCEILVRTRAREWANKLTEIAYREARRFEEKFSRYNDDNVCFHLNHSQGRPVEIDLETYRLLVYAQQLFDWSDGLFDITCGVLRRIWRFDQTEQRPEFEQITQLLPLVGFEKLTFSSQQFVMPAEMEIDFGGIGKEYCADRIYGLLAEASESMPVDFLINLGGDLVAHAGSQSSRAWQVGIESAGNQNLAGQLIELRQGALATSGTSKRYLQCDGEIFGHILNPKTGYPVREPPQSVTVAAGTCSAAGGLATLAMLKGTQAETFLESQGVRYWVLRERRPLGCDADKKLSSSPGG